MAKGKGNVGVIIGVVVLVLAVCAGAAFWDSCNRHKDTRPCFGSSSQR